MDYFAGSVPIVECVHHTPHLNLSYDGEVYEAESWVSSPQARAGLLSRLKTAMQTNPDTWTQQYDLQRLLSFLGDRAPLAKLLETQIEEHSGDANVATKRFLGELPKLRSVAHTEDDAEESGLGYIDLHKHSDLDLGQAWDGERIVGIRFRDVRIPKGTHIKNAYVQFTAEDSREREPTELTIRAELSGNAKPFMIASHNISSRERTTSAVEWSPEAWEVAGERSEKQRTPDLSSLIREVVGQDDWQAGNALVLIITGSGERDAESYDGDPTAAPMLYVEWAP